MLRVRTLIKLCLILLIIQSVSCEQLCTTAECEARGKEYNDNLNATANPCRDFYSFACGNWQKNHPGPKYISMWSILDLIDFEFASIIRETLESYNYQDGDSFKFLQAKMIYEACIEIPHYPIREANDIARAVLTVGRLPRNSLWLIHLTYLYLTGESSLFRIKMMASRESMDLPVLMLLEPQSAYGSIYHEDIWKPEEKEAYTHFLFLIMKSLQLADSDAHIRERIERVFQFRQQFNRIITENKKKKPEAFEPFTGDELDDWFSQTLHHVTSSQDIRWREVLQPLLEYVPADMRLTRKVIAMRQKEYFVELMNLLKRTPEEVIASHMEIYFVETHLKLNEDMYKLLERTSIEPHSLTRYIKDTYYPRWQTCIEDLNMKGTLEKLIYKKWFPKRYTDIIRAMNDRIKLAIVDEMENSSWLNKATREETARKIKKVEEWVGFPPWIKRNGKPTIGRNQDNILTAQATLSLSTNFLYIHAPLLLPPMFSPTMPNVYNYAGMGTTLGHELYHVVDDCGRYELKTGDLVWWESAMRDECLKRKALFIDAYNKITDRDYKIRYNLRVKSDTSSSILEDIPDIMGLRAAYNAYKELELKDKTVCQTLPNFENYSCDQMFYIAFANTYCAYYTNKTAENVIMGQSAHSIESIRINGAVAQMKSFGTAFECPVETPMNPLEKLDLWK